MKKKFYIIVLLAACAGIGISGCRSRITASVDADELRNAKDALASASDDAPAEEHILDSMSDMTEDEFEEIQEEKKEEEQTTEAQTETTSEAEQETTTETETETEEAPEVTTTALQEEKNEENEDPGNEIPEVTTTARQPEDDKIDKGDSNDKEAKPSEAAVSDSGDKKENEEYPKDYDDKKNTGDDVVNPNSGNSSDKGDGTSSGSGGDNGSGGSNPGSGPGLSDENPTVPPEMLPAEPEEEQPEEKDPEPLPTQKEEPVEEPEIYVTVSFDSVGGALNGVGSMVLKVGDQYGGMPEAYKSGFTFGGWYTYPEGNGQRIDAGDIVSIREDHTLYAFFVQREIHNVHFVTEGVTGNYWLGRASEADRQIYVGDTYGAAFPVPRTRLGYTFLGWYDAPVGGNYVTNTDVFYGNSDTDLYAHMEYDPLAYWTGILNNVNGYPCQQRGVVCEYDQPNAPVINPVFVARLGTGPIQAADNSTAGMTTEEILKAKPNTSIMIKIISNMGNAENVANEVLTRFPVSYPYYRQLYIIPSEAENGDAATTLIYNLAIKMELWPESFTRDPAINPWGLDAVNKAVEELGVAYPTIVHYGQ